MSKYGVNYYGASKYGQAALLSYSVLPITATVFSEPDNPNFRKVTLNWQSPSGTFTRFRLVRNQNGYPETSEDGVIVFDEFASAGTVSRSYFIDGQDNPNDIRLLPGRQVFYKVFLFTDSKIWVDAGGTSITIPGDHNAHSQMMNLLPRVFTTSEQSPLGEIDTSSDLYNFLWGLSFTEEELLTTLDLLRPRHSGLETPLSILEAETLSLGLTPEPGLPVKNQKKLVREAMYMYTHKGTKLGLEDYVESLTGYAPTITVSPNLMLTAQDSTFYGSTGNWVATNATITADITQTPPSNGANVIDTTYSCKIVATNSGHMDVGADLPITKGVPVTAGTSYTVSLKFKSPASAGNITTTVYWYTSNGSAISNNSSTTVAANGTWKDSTVTATAPSTASYASVRVTYSASGTYYVDMVYFRPATFTTYDEARAIDIYLSPNKINYFVNPSFESNVTDGWTLAGSATATQDTDVTTLAYSGLKSAKVVATGNWTYTSSAVPVTYGLYYTVSGYAKTTANLSVRFIGLDSLGNPTAHTDTYSIGTLSSWARFTATDLIGAAESEVASYKVQLYGGSGTYHFDCMQFETSPIATDYFDGSLPTDFGAVWYGTSNNSISGLYPTKTSKVTRLGKTLQYWVPENSFWRIRTYAGVESTNLTV